MTIINVNSISGINSITAQGASGIEFYDSSGNSVHTVTGDGLTVGTGATISGSTNTITASTNGSEKLQITSGGDLDLTGGGNIIINEDSKLHFEGNADDDLNAIWKADTENTVFVTSRYNIANIIDSNNDDTASSWSVRHNGTTLAGSTELITVQSDGKVVLPTSSPGIQFGTFSSPVTSTTLDDYEEGTFTPTVPGLLLSTAIGHYVKVGNLATCIFYIDIGTKTYIDGGSGTTTLEVNLPFANSNTSTSYAGASIGNVRFVDFTTSNALQFAMNIGGSDDHLTGRWIRNNSNFDVISLGDLYSSFSVHASVTYRVA